MDAQGLGDSENNKKNLVLLILQSKARVAKDIATEEPDSSKNLQWFKMSATELFRVATSRTRIAIMIFDPRLEMSYHREGFDSLSN